MFDIPFLVSESFSLRDYFFCLHPVLASEVFLEIALRSKSAGSFVPAESLSAGKAAWAVNRKVASLKASILKEESTAFVLQTANPSLNSVVNVEISVSSYRILSTLREL